MVVWRLAPARLILVIVVGVSAWLGGVGPGLLATTFGLLAIVITNDTPGDWQELGTKLLRFGPLAILLSILFQGLHASRRRAEIKEEEYRRSEGRYRRLIETAGQGIWVIDQTGRTTYANPRLGEILGIHPSRLIGRSLADFLVDDTASWTGSEAQPDPFAWHEVRLKGGDGASSRAIVDCAVTVGPDEIPGAAARPQDDATGGLLVMVTDVTPLKQAEEALREKESVLRSFYESSVMAMGVVELTDDDDTYFYVSANAAHGQIFGVETGKLEGKRATQLKAPPEMLRTWNERFRECRATCQAGPASRA